MRRTTFVSLALALLLTGLAVTGQAAGDVTGNVRVYSIPSKPFDPSCPHPTYSPVGSEAAPITICKAYATGASAPIYYRWDFDGNGTWDQALSVSGDPRSPANWYGMWYQSNSTDPNYDLEGLYRYPKLAAGSGPKVYLAMLQMAEALTGDGLPSGASNYAVFPVIVYPVGDDTAGRTVREDKAIEDGLWNLFKTQTRSPVAENETASWGDPFTTALAVKAFEEAGFLPDGSYEARDANPYAFTAKGGLNYLGLNCLPTGVTGLPVVADSNGNGIGLRSSGGLTYCDGTAAALAAFAGAGTWGRIAPMGFVSGRTYASIAQDLVDELAYQQYVNVSGTARGSWFGDLVESEWPIYGLLCAKKVGSEAGLTIPPWVTGDLATWLAYAQVSSGPSDGGFCIAPGFPPCVRSTGFGMSGLELAGVDSGDSRMTRASEFIGRTWDGTEWGTGGGNVGNFQAMFAIALATSGLVPSPYTFGGHDWRSEYGTWLTSHQFGDGKWVIPIGYGDPWQGGVQNRTPPSVLTLMAAEREHHPVALPDVAPATTMVGNPVTFWDRGSFTPEFGQQIVRYEWDFDYQDSLFTVDAVSTSAMWMPQHAYGSPGTHAAALRVLDDAGELSEVAAVQVTVIGSPVDTTPPTLAAPADVELQATAPWGVSHFFAAVADDNVEVTSLQYFVGDNEIASPHSFPVGATTVTCEAKDAAGNCSTAAFTVTVLSPYAPSGVLQPFNADGSSVFKAGSTAPIKVTLGGWNGGVVTGAIIRLYWAKVDNDVEGTVMEALSTSAADSGNTMREVSPGSYLYNLSTKPFTTGTYALHVAYPDGTSSSVRFSVK